MPSLLSWDLKGLPLLSEPQFTPFTYSNILAFICGHLHPWNGQSPFGNDLPVCGGNQAITSAVIVRRTFITRHLLRCYRVPGTAQGTVVLWS